MADSRPPGFFFLFTALVLMAGWSCPHAARGDDEDDLEFRGGLIGTYTDQRGATVRRIDRKLALAWDDTVPDRRLSAGPLQIEWTGYLMSQAPGDYQLKAYLEGRLTIVLDGKTVLDASSAEPGWQASPKLTLPFDYHELTIRYASTGSRGRIALFWSGPQFQLEPIAARQFHHDPEMTPDDRFDRGEELVHALRCAACHQVGNEPTARSAPAIDRLAGNLSYEWLVDRLTARSPDATPHATVTAGQMPSFGFSRQQATDVAAYLISGSKAAPRATPAPKKTDRDQGRALLLSRGCLACHQLGDIGERGLFGGGDLAQVASKRPADFFARWLSDPATINQDHRMPQFDLTKTERGNLAAFLQSLGKPATPIKATQAADAEQVDRGRKLAEAAQCARCHHLPGPEPAERAVPPLSAQARWETTHSCLQRDPDRHDQPSFQLTDEDRLAIKAFVSDVGDGHAAIVSAGERLLRENNCLSCHPRGRSPGLAETATQAASLAEQLAPQLPAMIPPSLANVGDKLHNGALADTIARKRPGRRSYLQVKMPRFTLTDQQLAALVDHFVTSDRIPEGQSPPAGGTSLDAVALQAAGSRLVTPDGFGCTSCHQIGKALPAKAPVNARGPVLTMLGDQVRRAWFDRFVRNPARIVPRMEMPSVKVAVRGLLDDNVDHQLSAVWDVLNTRGFEPPRPDPVRVVRYRGDEEERAVMLTDVVRTPERNYLKPLLVGLANRHSMLFDLEAGRLVMWSVGDVARQHTEGKTWFWEAAGTPVLETGIGGPELTLSANGKPLQSITQGQFVTELDRVEHAQQKLAATYRLRFQEPGGDAARIIQVVQTFAPFVAEDARYSGVQRSLLLSRLAPGTEVRLQVVDSKARAEVVAGNIWVIDERTRIRLVAPPGAGDASDARVSPDGSLTTTADADGNVRLTLAYVTTVPVDRFPALAAPTARVEPVPLDVVPGYAAVRVPLATEIMPTGLAWRPDGRLMIASLKGRVWTARDTDGDDLEDQLTQFSDELAAPYGLAAEEDYVDVINKYGLLRLSDTDGDGRADRHVTIASGWGHTTDYHDWAVGLPRDRHGNYYVALPCQQDQRKPAAAHLRGTVLKLAPRSPSQDDPHLFDIQPVTAGHRFPMGIALNRDQELFVTDNQGNYNPFNELNHVRPGSRFGFINTIDRRPGFAPPLTPPAIDIPHPWTRSVNGICFLETPASLREHGEARFGPFEGHLIGCEYDTRRLIRMSLQHVGNTIQGAAYPFSYDEPPQGPPFLGPLVGGISPAGDLYVGGIRDSGWGGANNVGELVRLRPLPDQLPGGIAEVRATPNGFRIEFTRPMDPTRAADLSNYSLASYTRISTPRYGGDDTDRRVESIDAVDVAADASSVLLRVGELRAGFVYELNVKNLNRQQTAFFPSLAHYTLRVQPE